MEKEKRSRWSASFACFHSQLNSCSRCRLNVSLLQVLFLAANVSFATSCFHVWSPHEPKQISRDKPSQHRKAWGRHSHVHDLHCQCPTPHTLNWRSCLKDFGWAL